jgi:FixJ family two-component response regulator
MCIAIPDRVFIIDDDPAVRESVAALVCSRGSEAETYESGEDFLARFNRSSNGCVVVDMRMSGMSGMELQEQLAIEGLELPVIIITGYADVPSAVAAMRNGAITFLEKPCSEHKLWESISQALQRQAALGELRRQRIEIRSRLATLTADENRVLDKLIEGRPNKAIAKELDLGLRTVELRRATILHKLDARSLAELVRMVVFAGESSPVSTRPMHFEFNPPGNVGIPPSENSQFQTVAPRSKM